MRVASRHLALAGNAFEVRGSWIPVLVLVLVLVVVAAAFAALVLVVVTVVLTVAEVVLAADRKREVKVLNLGIW